MDEANTLIRKMIVMLKTIKLVSSKRNGNDLYLQIIFNLNMHDHQFHRKKIYSKLNFFLSLLSFGLQLCPRKRFIGETFKSLAIILSK